jgi:putative tryptophan/tyrosine transport system substrate-binding protein
MTETPSPLRMLLFRHTKRREFITLLGGAAAAWPIVARAQQSERMRRIGVVMAYAESDPNGQVQFRALREHLQRLGWTEGTNLRINLRFGAGDPVRIRQLAKELLSLGPDLMVSNSNVVTTILQSEVHTLPLVFVSVSDPIGSGFIADLARPGGNITGFANFQASMGGKWLEKLLEIAPLVQRVGLVYHPEPPNFGYLRSAEAVAPPLKIKLDGLPVHGRAEIEQALETFAREPRGGLIIAPNVVTFANSSLIVALAERYRLPAIYPFTTPKKAGSSPTDSMQLINSGKARSMPIKFSEGRDHPICPCSTQVNLRSSSTSRRPGRSVLNSRQH